MFKFCWIFVLTCVYGCLAGVEIGSQHDDQLSKGMQRINIQNFAPLKTAHHDWVLQYIQEVLDYKEVGHYFPPGVPEVELVKDGGHYEQCELNEAESKAGEVDTALNVLVEQIPELFAAGVTELKSGLKITGGTLFYVAAKGYASRKKICSIGNYVQALLVMEGTIGK